jgi:hypothetical protein
MQKFNLWLEERDVGSALEGLKNALMHLKDRPDLVASAIANAKAAMPGERILDNMESLMHRFQQDSRFQFGGRPGMDMAGGQEYQQMYSGVAQKLFDMWKMLSRNFHGAAI